MSAVTSLPTPRRVQGTYYTLMLGNTLAASFIWGINTLFLLDAGLSNLEAFAANAFFTAGMLIFEIPTGVVADTVGRRASYLLGTVTLAVTTVTVLAAVGVGVAVLGVGDRVGAARAGLHVLLGRGRCLARRRPEGHRLPRQPRDGLRPGADRGRHRDAVGLGARRRDRAGDEPRRAVPRARRASSW